MLGPAPFCMVDQLPAGRRAPTLIALPVGQALGSQMLGLAPFCMVDQITCRKSGPPTLIVLSVGQDLGLHLIRPGAYLHVRSITSRETGPDSDRAVSRPGPRFRMIQHFDGSNSASTGWTGPARHCYGLEHQPVIGPCLESSARPSARGAAQSTIATYRPYGQALQSVQVNE
jgi:hypothetical protein